jgi:4-hydroxy-3-methylbut-2-enyl diphosphate reductase
MKIILAKSAGFCFGVKRAIEIALKTAKAKLKVYILGDIVHNEDVIKLLCRHGLKRINHLSQRHKGILIIRAHGEPFFIKNKAKALGYKIVDATCPMVKEIHRIVRTMENTGYKIIIIGDKKHDEVRGIKGELKKEAIVIEDLKQIPYSKIKKIKKAALVAQSTQNLEKVLKIFKILNSHIKDLRFFNTVCGPTRTKQQEIKRLPLKNNVVIIIGSKTSANTRRLFEISKALNKRSYWINSKKEIKASWFDKKDKIAVTAGASTPEWIIQEVITKLKKISKEIK